MIARFKSGKINVANSVFGTAVTVAVQDHPCGKHYTEISAIGNRLEKQGLTLTGSQIRKALYQQLCMGNLSDVGEGFFVWKCDLAIFKPIYRENGVSDVLLATNSENL